VSRPWPAQASGVPVVMIKGRVDPGLGAAAVSISRTPQFRARAAASGTVWLAARAQRPKPEALVISRGGRSCCGLTAPP